MKELRFKLRHPNSDADTVGTVSSYTTVLLPGWKKCTFKAVSDCGCSHLFQEAQMCRALKREGKCLLLWVFRPWRNKLGTGYFRRLVKLKGYLQMYCYLEELDTEGRFGEKKMLNPVIPTSARLPWASPEEVCCWAYMVTKKRGNGDFPRGSGLTRKASLNTSKKLSGVYFKQRCHS